MKIETAAFFTQTDIVAKYSGLTIHNAVSSISLFTGWLEFPAVIIPAVGKNLLNFSTTHLQSLPFYREDLPRQKKRYPLNERRWSLNSKIYDQELL